MENKENKTAEDREKSIEEQEFDREVARLMAEEPEGKSKKGRKKSHSVGRRPRKKWSTKRKVFTVLGAAAVLFIVFKATAGKKNQQPCRFP